MIAARQIFLASSENSEDEMYRELFAQFVTDTMPTDVEIEIPGAGPMKSFVFVGGNGAHVSFPDVVSLYQPSNNFGIYQCKYASIRFPNAEGLLGGQCFNNLQGPTGVGMSDIYLPKITGFRDNYALYTSSATLIRFHFGITCDEILAWNNINKQVNANRANLICTDGTLTWNGSSWEKS